MTTNTTPNLLAAHLTGGIIAAVKYSVGSVDDRLHLLDFTIYAHTNFPSLASEEILRELHQLRDGIRAEMREEMERFRDLDGDHHEAERERLPEYDYPR